MQLRRCVHSPPPGVSGSGGLRTQKNPQLAAAGRKKGRKDLGLLDEAGLDGLDRDPHALRAAIGEFDLDPLQVRTELAGSQAGNVRADAAALLGLTLTVDDLAHGRAFSGDCANSCHDVS